MAALIHKETNQVLSSQVVHSHSLLKRMKGLIGSQALIKDQAMWLKPCSSIHTYFMSFPIDVVFTDKNLRVTGVVENISPWKIVNQKGRVMNIWQSFLSSETYSIIKLFQNYSAFEFSGGTLADKIKIQEGDQLHVVY